VAPKARASNGARQAKMVVTGPYGAGKTTLVQTMSEIAVLSTERDVGSGHVLPGKRGTTVAMDFGRITLDDDLALLLFGTPGQRRFDFMWQILAEGMIGFIVLVDASRPESYAEARDILGFFTDVAEVPFVVAVNKGGDHPDGGVARARSEVGLPDGVRCVAVDARDKDSVRGVLLALLEAALEDATAREAAAL
jgi:signal recognition particle receptor subunit beta